MIDLLPSLSTPPPAAAKPAAQPRKEGVSFSEVMRARKKSLHEKEEVLAVAANVQTNQPAEVSKPTPQAQENTGDTAVAALETKPQAPTIADAKPAPSAAANAATIAAAQTAAPLVETFTGALSAATQTLTETAPLDIETAPATPVPLSTTAETSPSVATAPQAAIAPATPSAQAFPTASTPAADLTAAQAGSQSAQPDTLEPTIPPTVAPTAQPAVAAADQRFSAQQIPRQPEFSADLAQQISRGMQTAIRQSQPSLTIRLNPAELGAIDIRLTHTPNGLVVTMLADQAATSKMLESQMEQLRATLADSGVQLSQLNVGQNGQNFSFEEWSGRQQQAAAGHARGQARSAHHADVEPQPSTSTAPAVGVDYRI